MFSTRVSKYNMSTVRACCYKGWGLCDNTMYSLPFKREDMYPMLMTVLLLYGTDAELLIYVSSQLLFLRAEHLDVGFMLSGFRRRQIKEVLHPFEAKCSCRPDKHIPSMLH